MWLNANIAKPKEEGLMVQHQENFPFLEYLHSSNAEGNIQGAGLPVPHWVLWRPLVEARLPALLTDDSF